MLPVDKAQTQINKLTSLVSSYRKSKTRKKNNISQLIYVYKKTEEMCRENSFCSSKENTI